MSTKKGESLDEKAISFEGKKLIKFLSKIGLSISLEEKTSLYKWVQKQERKK